jgi:hypothetical protein
MIHYSEGNDEIFEMAMNAWDTARMNRAHFVPSIPLAV